MKRESELGGAEFHAHFASEDLVELALEQMTGRLNAGSTFQPALTRARACPQCSRELDAALADIERVRTALGEITAVDEQRAVSVADTVLGRTTREDLSWRGDWRVVGRFLRERWSASLAVRLLAASLLLHLLALPVLAIVLVLQIRESPTFRTGIEPAVVDLPVIPDPSEPERELVREPEPDAPGPLSNAPELSLSSERLIRARRQLLETGAPVLSGRDLADAPGDGPARRVAQLLIARSQRLGLGDLDASLPEPEANSPLVERALWAEVLLDDWAIGGRADPRLAAAVSRLSEAGLSNSALVRAEVELARHAQRRAASYGLDLPGVPGGQGPRTALSRDWFEALERSCAPSSPMEASGPLARWLAWGREHAR